jgi:hypothetical protein
MLCWRQGCANAENLLLRHRTRHLVQNLFSCFILNTKHTKTMSKLVKSHLRVYISSCMSASVCAWRKAAHNQRLKLLAIDNQADAKLKSFIFFSTMHQWQRECKTLRRLRHLKGCLGRSHDSKVLHNVWMRWRTLSLFHAQLARASDLVITRRISRCLRNTFWRWEAEWEKVAVRQRAGDVSEERHCSFVIHDVFRLWAVRQKQSSRCVYVCVRAQCVCM